MSATDSDLSADYFENIPLWPNISSTGDKITGTIPVARIESWRKLPEFLDDKFFKRPNTQLIFRGHRRYDWTLTPNLGRIAPNQIITEEIAEAQIRLFRRAVRGRLTDRSLVDSEEELELWSVGQHHELQTPLLDWTYSPYVALFFAFEQWEDETSNPYRALYILNKTYVEQDDKCAGIQIWEPRKDDHGRLVNQAGLFTKSSYGNSLEIELIESLTDEVLQNVSDDDESGVLANYICKVYIPNKEQAECMEHLRMMNVHHASLFPDLIGAARYCNSLVGLAAKSSRLSESDLPRDVAKASRPTEEPKPRREVSPSPEVSEDFSFDLDKDLQVLFDSYDKGDYDTTYLIPGLVSELLECVVVDWAKRDSSRAAMRTAARVFLRRKGHNGYKNNILLDEIVAVVERNTSHANEVLA